MNTPQPATGSAAGKEPSPRRFWPFSTRTAVLMTPVLLLILLVLWGVGRTVLHFEKAAAGWVLLGIVILGVLPILLVVL
ncbi:MAG TPA: hypothetical protein VGJ44_23865, partial [Kribbellaceae bacterium]